MNIPPGLVQNPATGHIRHYEMDDNWDADSVEELEFDTGEVNVPPGLFQSSPMGITKLMKKLMKRTVIQMQTPPRS